MDCPRCKSNKYTRAGFVSDRQRYKCQECHYLYTVSEKSTAKPMIMKRFALHLYLEGMGFRSIGRILGVSNVSVLKWIRSFGEQAEGIRTEQSIDVVELDELHTYIGQKNVTVGYGLLLIGMGSDSSHSCWVIGEYTPVKNSGMISRRRKSETL